MTTIPENETPSSSPARNEDERKLLALYEKDRGVEWTKAHVALILEEARALGYV